MDRHFKLIDCKARCATLAKRPALRERLGELVPPDTVSAASLSRRFAAGVPTADDDDVIQREQVAVMRGDDEHRAGRPMAPIRARIVTRSPQARANPW